MDICELKLLHQIHALLEFRIRFTGISDDDVGAERDIRPLTAQSVERPPNVSHVVPAIHPLSDCCRTCLQGDMEMRPNESRVAKKIGKSGIQMPWLDGAQSQRRTVSSDLCQQIIQGRLR